MCKTGMLSKLCDRISAFTVLLFLLPVLAVNPAQLFSQDEPRDLTQMSLEELAQLKVYSASKFSQKVSEAPASISIITAEDIQRYGYRVFTDIIRNVTGFFVTYDRNYSYFGVRGFGRAGDYNTRILILINGQRLNDNVYDSTGIDSDFPVPLDFIERVEIIRGPGSSLYGTNAFFAVINVVTKRGRSLKGGYLSVEAGSRDSYVGTAAYGDKYKNGLETAFSVAYFNSKGYRRLYFPEFDSPENNNGIAQDADANRSAGFFANISYNDFTAQLAFNSREKTIPTASYGTIFNDRRTQSTEDRGYFELKFERNYRDRWDILTRTSFNIYSYEGNYPYDGSEDESVYSIINTDRAAGRWWSGEAQITRKIAGKHHITAGSEWRYSFMADQLNFDEPPDYYLYLDSRTSATNSSIYLQSEFAVHEKLLLSAGFRYDNYSSFGGSTNPRLALVYSPTNRTRVKVLYGHAFRAPNVYELYYQDAITSKNNLNLQPETIRTAELMVERQFGRRFRVAGSAYRYRVVNLIAQEIDPADGLMVFKNSGRMHAKGIELELEGRDFHGIDGRIGYALQRLENDVNRTTALNSPQHIVNFNLFVPLYGTKVGTGLVMRYMSPRNTLGGGSVGGHYLADISLLYRKLFPNLDLSAGIYNLFNKRYSDPASEEHRQNALLQDGRAFRVNLTYRFSHSDK